MIYDILRLEKDQLSQDCSNAKKISDVRQNIEKRSAELLNLERQTTQNCATTIQKYEKGAILSQRTKNSTLKKLPVRGKRLKVLLKL